MTEFSKRLKQARFNKGYSLKQLADAYNKKYKDEKMSTSNLSKWENDKTVPNIYAVQALCDVLDVSIDWITGFDTILEIKQLRGAETGNRKNKVIPRKEWVDNIVRAAEMAAMKNELQGGKEEGT